ncbi:hypothetical protein GJV08_02230 [Enterobacteriaceae bacterium RIT692]|nr:hypothetical protein [Enterobacteriaceae bacterium RIT692]
MEILISKLEADIDEMKTDISLLKTDVAIIKSNYVTKGDLHQAINQQTKWIVAGILSTAGLTLALARWLF